MAKRKKKPGYLTRVLESVSAAVRDAQGLDTLRTPLETSSAETQLDIELTPEEEAQARREWMQGVVGQREAALKDRFNGKTETMAQVVRQMHRGAAEFALEIEAGTAWFLHEGDPKRFEEEPVTPDVEALRAELGEQMGRASKERDAADSAREEIVEIDQLIKQLIEARGQQRQYLREAVVNEHMAWQRAKNLRKQLPQEERGDTGPEDEVDASSGAPGLERGDQQPG